MIRSIPFPLVMVAATAVAAAGCGQPSPPPQAPAAAAPAVTSPAAPAVPTTEVSASPLPTISLGGAKPSASSASAGATTTSSDHEARIAAIEALKPLQSLLGKWRGITRKEVNDFKGIEEPEWVWDLRSDRAHPALVMESPKGVYYRKLRLTGTGSPDEFQLVATDAEGRERVLAGRLTEPVELFQEAGTAVQHKFRMTFEETGDAKDRWQLALAQQNNDRYLVELSRLRPTGPQRIDTIGHQREGTSVAQSDTDYGEKKCIISGGLGTIAVSYQGKTYWVCCTGCQAAFNEDPEGWLRDAAKKAN